MSGKVQDGFHVEPTQAAQIRLPSPTGDTYDKIGANQRSISEMLFPLRRE